MTGRWSARAVSAPEGRDALRLRYEIEGAATRRYDAAQFWDRRYHRRRFEHVDALLRALVRRDDTFLDVGCGTGEYLALATGLGAHAVGIDLSEAYCGRVTSSGLVAVVGDGTGLPMADASCDVVLCSEVIEHVPAVLARRCIDEITRVARRAVVVTTPNALAVVRRVARRIIPSRVTDLDLEVGHINLLGPSELTSSLERPGWQLTQFAVRHVIPPLVGDVRPALPSVLAPMVSQIERGSDRWCPSAGNMMFAVLEPTPG